MCEACCCLCSGAGPAPADQRHSGGACAPDFCGEAQPGRQVHHRWWLCHHVLCCFLFFLFLSPSATIQAQVLEHCSCCALTGGFFDGKTDADARRLYLLNLLKQPGEQQSSSFLQQTLSDQEVGHVLQGCSSQQNSVVLQKPQQVQLTPQSTSRSLRLNDAITPKVKPLKPQMQKNISSHNPIFLHLWPRWVGFGCDCISRPQAGKSCSATRHAECVVNARSTYC